MEKVLENDAPPATDETTPSQEAKVWVVNFAGNTIVDATRLLKQEKVRTDLSLLRSKLDTIDF